jgi:hypothetical protein
MRGRRACWKSTAAALAAVALAGCTTTAPTASPRVTTTSVSGAMVIELSIGGGLAPAAVRVSDSLPRVWIGGDGRYLRQTMDGAPNPALPTLEERRIPHDALAGLLDQARGAGLLEDNRDYGKPLIADAMVTRVVIVTGGSRHEVLVSALGYPNASLDAAAVAARAKLSQFVDVLQHPERIAGVSGPEPYAPNELAVFVLGTAGATAQNAPATWPLGDLGEAGAPTDWPVGSARCLVVTGGDVNSVANVAAGKDRFTPWRSGNGLWDIALRPLLPDEHNCADVVG